MIDQKDAHVLLVADRPHGAGEVRHLRFRQSGRGFVEQDEARIRREGSSHAEPALVTLGKRVGGRTGVSRQAEQLQQPCCPVPGLAPPCADTERSDLDVLAHGERPEGVAVLKGSGEPGPPAAARAPARDVAALELDVPRSWTVEARENVHERRLACAVRPDQADDVPAAQLERDVTKSVNALEGPGDTGGPERLSGPPPFVHPSACQAPG